MKFGSTDKVLFIIHDVMQDDNDFPLGPAYLAAVLKKEGASVEAYCMDVFHYSHEDLAKHLDENDYDLIGVSFMAARYKETVEPLCKVINKHKKDAWLVLGGHGPSPIPEYVLCETGADVVAIGEAENTIIDLLECKLGRKHLSDVPGVAFINMYDELAFTGHAVPVKNLDDIPFPLWEIFPMDKYTRCMEMFNMRTSDRSLAVISSRGCTNECNFCVDGETMILTDKGQKRIKDLKEGEVVKAYDENEKKVQNTVINKIHKRTGADRYKIKTADGEELIISGEHPIFTKRGWVAVNELTYEDEVMKND